MNDNNDAYEYDEGKVTQWNGGREVPASANSQDALAVIGKIFEFAREKQITKREIERYRTVRDIAITDITKKYEFAHALLNKTFEERRMVIEKQFEVIDKGLEQHNYQLVNMGLQHITAIVKDNPFKLFQVTTSSQRHAMLEDGKLSIE